MAQLPSAFSCHLSSVASSEVPLACSAKSTIVVVPPNAAAVVPVSNVSAEDVPPNGISMCVWTSIPPGSTYLPVASITESACAMEPGAATAAIVSPSTSTSEANAPVAATTVPPLIKMLTAVPPARPRTRPCSAPGSPWARRLASLRSLVPRSLHSVRPSRASLAPSCPLRLDQALVGIGTAVPVELPQVADLGELAHVEVADDDLIIGVARRRTDELPARVHEVGLAVEVVVAEWLDADPVDRADEVLVGHGGGRLLKLPQVRRQASRRRGRVEHDLRAGQAECPPALGEVPVVADVDADPPDGGVEDRIAEVAGPEVELLPEPLDLRQVVLAVLAQV